LTDPNSAIFRATAAGLRSSLSDYEHSVLAAPQRRFLMKAMQKLAPADPLFPTLAAEELASQLSRSAYDAASAFRIAPRANIKRMAVHDASSRAGLSSNPIASWPKWKTASTQTASR